MVHALRHCRWLPILALSLVANAAPLLAQSPEALPPGSRVRLAIADTVRQVPIGRRAQLIYGTVTATTDDTLYLTVPNTSGSLAVPRTSLKALAISKGLPSRSRSIAVSGAQFALAGAAEFLALHAIQRDDRAFGSNGRAALVGGGVGLALGVFFGARGPVERWRDIPLPARRVP